MEGDSRAVAKKEKVDKMMMKLGLSCIAVLLVGDTADAFSPVNNNKNQVRQKKLFSSTADETTSWTGVTRVPVFDEVCETTGVTLTRFMNEVAQLNPDLRELTTIFGAIDTACKAISNEVKRSQLPFSESLSYMDEVPSQGEEKKTLLDVITNKLLKRALRFTGRLGVLASEAEDAPVDLIGGAESDSDDIVIDETSNYVVCINPLDGSNHVNAGIPTGTVIGIFEHDESCELSVQAIGDELKEQEAKCLAATLQPGTNLVAAAYCLYSSSTFLTLTLGNGVFMFTLDEAIGEFVLSRPNVKIPESSTIYSFNEANCEMWDEPLRNVVEGWREGTGASGKRFSSRYMGSMVGDIHRTLLSGGVFGYPRDTRNPNGKLRLLYEAVPISFIMEQAGGLATTGTQRAMEIVPQAVHQRTPVMMGSKNDILEIIDAYLSAGSQTK